ncbi:BON domain-containing protein [Wielerella bovis]|uniref:BON domain-containing protein n=1 Tax=Wielerella bovis TaxID=2917790 RepID=UPI0020188BFF|nr:BON domain-containing protein [Wielerella bovis]ULJ63520.1 BON domain-containing protein [Wielerella bovis]
MTKLPRSLKVFILASVIMGTLNACSTATLVGSGIAAGAAADFAVDRRLATAQLDDQAMELSVKQRASSLVKQSNPQSTTTFSVISYNRKIFLIGQAANQQERLLVEQAARTETKATSVYNLIQILPTVRTVANINHDTWITSKVRTRLLASGGVYPGHVKVATFNGITYVWGLLTPAQQAATTQVVRTTSGVRQVVTLYETYYPTNTYQ